MIQEQADIVDRLESYESDESGANTLLHDAAGEIKRLRMVLSSSQSYKPSKVNDIVLAALQGAATTMAMRHDMPAKRLVENALSLAEEMESRK